MGTLKTQLKRAWTVYSTDYHHKDELEKNNNCSKWIIKQVAKQIKDQNIQSNADEPSTIADKPQADLGLLQHPRWSAL